MKASHESKRPDGAAGTAGAPGAGLGRAGDGELGASGSLRAFQGRVLPGSIQVEGAGLRAFQGRCPVGGVQASGASGRRLAAAAGGAAEARTGAVAEEAAAPGEEEVEGRAADPELPDSGAVDRPAAAARAASAACSASLR